MERMVEAWANGGKIVTPYDADRKRDGGEMPWMAVGVLRGRRHACIVWDGC